MFKISKGSFQSGPFTLSVPEASVEKGSLIFVVGPNGSGKSTFLKGISGLLSPRSPNALYMSSHFFPQDGITGNDLLELFEVSSSPYYNPQLIEDFKVQHLLDHPLETLSSGERQKIFLSATLFHKNPVVALDEPLSFLDVFYYQILEKALIDYQKQGRIFFISNHNFNWSLRFEKSQTWVVFQNQILLRGLTTQVLGDIKLREIFGVTFELQESLDKAQRFVLIK